MFENRENQQFKIDYGELKFYFLNDQVKTIYCDKNGYISIYDQYNCLISNLHDEDLLDKEKKFEAFIKRLYEASILRYRDRLSKLVFFDRLLLPDGVTVTILRPEFSVLFEKPLLMEEDRELNLSLDKVLKKRSCILLDFNNPALARSISKYLIYYISNKQPLLLFNYDSSLLTVAKYSTIVNMWENHIISQGILEQKALINSYLNTLPQLFSIFVDIRVVDEIERHFLIKDIASQMLICSFNNFEELNYAFNHSSIFSQFEEIIVVKDIKNKTSVKCLNYSNQEEKFILSGESKEIPFQILSSY